MTLATMGDVEPQTHTPGLSHHRVLSALDRTGLPAWLIAFGFWLVMTLVGFIVLILVRAPDPAYYRNAVAFSAIVAFLILFYFKMGRGWHEDLVDIVSFDQSLEKHVPLLVPASMITWLEIVVALISGGVSIVLRPPPVAFYSNPEFWVVLYFFLVIQFMVIVFCIDLLMRQLLCLTRIADNIRIDLWQTEFYSTLANPMLRFFGLIIFGLCVITMSYMVFTEGEPSTTQMMVYLMPWYVPSVLLLLLYLVPYGRFRRRVYVLKQLELNRVGAALAGNPELMKDSPLAPDQGQLRMIDLLGYQDRIRQVREWPFTDRTRTMVLFGFLPPLTWVIAAFIEIMIEASL